MVQGLEHLTALVVDQYVSRVKEEKQSTLDVQLLESKCNPTVLWPLLLEIRFPAQQNTRLTLRNNWKKCKALYFRLVEFDEYLDYLLTVKE